MLALALSIQRAIDAGVIQDQSEAARRLGIAPDPLTGDMPDAWAGVEGLRFVEAALCSSARDGAMESLQG